MLFAYNVICTVIRLLYTLKRGKMICALWLKWLKWLNRLNDIRAMLFAVKL